MLPPPATPQATPPVEQTVPATAAAAAAVFELLPREWQKRVLYVLPPSLFSPSRAFHYNPDPALSLFCIHEEEGSDFFSSFPSLVSVYGPPGMSWTAIQVYIAAAAAVELLHFFPDIGLCHAIWAGRGGKIKSAKNVKKNTFLKFNSTKALLELFVVAWEKSG